MRIVIDAALKEAADKYDIEILFACESGSRAWGFPSPDSDYDVRFIYRRKRDTYTALFTENDHLAFPVTGDLDLYGWDIKKVLQLLYKSNCTPFEWIQSPVVYKDNEAFRKSFMALLPDYFSARKHIFHYLGIAAGALESMRGDRIKIKKLFYVLRPLLAAKWIAERKCFAPMNIEPLLDTVPDSLKAKIIFLIADKATKDEAWLIDVDKEILEFISSESTRLAAYAAQLEKDNFEKEKLDKYFREWIKE
ncbi:MAG: nucleotidyltransferase domain-containing protein [Taibaiella sp.]|nr:nucleotidyltransferase domain-containing protein [Taibaiella sp.]